MSTPPLSNPLRFAVIGNPIAHSRSPQIHSAFAAQLGISLTYDRLQSEPAQFEDDVRAFFADGGAGMNVTVPFKEAARGLCASADEAAEFAGAVNTLAPLSGSAELGLQGYNTDGVGLVRDLEQNLGIVLRGLRVLVVGAGGAVRGALGPLLAAVQTPVVLTNRTLGRAEALAERMRPQGVVQPLGFDELGGAGPFDLVINGTSAGLGGRFPPIPSALGAGAWVYDMAYGDAASACLAWGRSAGARALHDGLGMLVEQAGAAFEIWHGVRPRTGPVLAELRAAQPREPTGGPPRR